MPSDPLSETKACDLLARLFRGRGFDIQRNIPFAEYGVSFHIDGWDPKARVGFEFLSSEDEDHDDLTLREYQVLMAAQARGELSLFVIDEVEPLSATELAQAAGDFLDEMADGSRSSARKKPPARSAKKKPRALKSVATKKVKATGRVVKKAKAAVKKGSKRAAKRPRRAKRSSS